MKRLALLLIACLLLGSVSFAQQNPSDAPASKEDIEKYLDATQMREKVKTIMDLVSKQMHKNLLERLQKEPGTTPEQMDRASKMADNIFEKFPVDEMIDAMIPVYQKHFTKGNINDILTFYATPTGQKLLKEQPAMAAEAMQAVMPIAQKMATETVQRVEAQLAQAQNGGGATSNKTTKQSN
jgi:hypothetical protein